MKNENYPKSFFFLMSKDKNSTVMAIVDGNPHIESNSRNQSNPTINNAPSEMKE